MAETPTYERMRFHGEGTTYFGIVILNFVLTVITLGLYYPWAKEKYRKYIWNEMELKGSRFVFHGTGKEMFKGFIIAYVFIFGLYFFYFQLIASISLGSSETSKAIAISGLVFFILAFLFAFIPFAIFSAWRYRVSRTSWRGIYFSFNGNFRDFYKLYIKAMLLTIVTFGIYGAWFRVKVQKYLFQNTQLGDLKLDFHGKGGDYFLMFLLFYILVYPTLFLYTVVFIRKQFNFTINNTTIADERKRRALRSSLKNKEAFSVMLTNCLLLIVTLGLAFPFTRMRFYKLLFGNIEVPMEIDFDSIKQNESRYRNATGDELLDILDMDLGF